MVTKRGASTVLCRSGAGWSPFTHPLGLEVRIVPGDCFVTSAEV